MSQPTPGDPPPAGGGTMPPRTDLIVCRLNGVDFVTTEVACDAAGGEVVVKTATNVASLAGPLVDFTFDDGTTVRMTDKSRDEILAQNQSSGSAD